MYKGVRFRSRLEARWAVFFDLRGIEWVYEPAMYQLKSGGYIPDFKVYGLLAEVKPRVEVEPRWLTRLEELKKLTGIPVLLLLGDPGYFMHMVYHNKWVLAGLFDEGLLSFVMHDLTLINKCTIHMYSDNYKLAVNKTKFHEFNGR